MNKFKTVLKELRELAGIDQKTLASKINVSKSTVSGWETGRNQPNYDILIKLARYFSVTVDELIGAEGLD